nr:hypothetical protein [Agrobacterium rosae]
MDHTNRVVRVIDFENGKELGRYNVKGYASLTASASGQTVFAGQTEADVIHVIRTGINFSDMESTATWRFPNRPFSR